MFTWIWVFLLCSWKIKTLFLKLEDQKLQTMQLKVLWTFKNIFETLHDLNDSDKKNKMLKTPS